MNKLNIYFIYLISILLFMSCNDEIENEISDNNEIEKSNSILGKKLENPYSVTNMKKALENLKKNNKNLNKGEITVSHLYIKFKPKNEEDISLLKIDSTLNLFDYPMDYKEIEGQYNYRDPEVSVNQPTYQYASVEVGYKFPDVEYEILEDLFIPEEIETKKNDNFYVGELVYEALKITKNLDINDNTNRRPEWVPAGRIRQWDNSLERYVAPEGLKVRATRWFTTHIGFVNSNGYYRCDGDFRGRARYRIDWERHNFALRSGGFSSAQYKGPYKIGNWNWQIEDGEIHQYYGTIFRAAFHYYYQNNRGLRRPPENSFWRTQLRIGAYTRPNDDANGVHSWFWRGFGLLTPVKIYTYEKSNRQTYATTIHELAHASHWNMDRIDFIRTDDIVIESWARGVEKELTSLIYGNLDYTYKYSRLRYTGVVEDLIDKPKPVTSYFYWTEEDPYTELTRTYNDKVAGYSIRQLEDALIHKKTWYDWEKSITTISNSTAPFVRESFQFWKKD